MNADARTEWMPVHLSESQGPQIYLELLGRPGRQEVGILDSIPFSEISDLLGSIASSIEGTLRKANPKKATIELGVEFGLEEGKLVALIARGTGKANLKIGLEW